MSTTMRSLARPLRSVIAARPAMRTYATIPTKNPTPSGPMEPSREQAMPMGSFYEAILNTPQPIPDVKPEEPASSVKENLQQQAEASDAAPAKRGRKPKAKTEPAATATAGSAPTASAAASPKATAKEAAAKSTVSSSSPDARAAATVAPSALAETSPPPVPTIPPPTENTSAQEKAKVIFGSSLAGPAERAERLAQIRSKSKNVAGVLVPPKPEEPDNCCMSGCVNCVWDRFRDEMEEWAMANAEAERRIAAGKTEVSSIPKQEPVVDHTTVSMDDDGGGSETNWAVGAAPTPQPSGKIAKDFWDEELYKNVPVGIREFMKQEKKLKEKHMREGSSGG